MPFALAGAAVSAGAGLIGASMQSSATSKAAAQAQQRFEQQRADLAPYRDAAQPALQAQGALLGLQGQPAADAAMANFQHSPGYQWQMGEGLRAVDAGAAASGMLRSGATLKAEQTFGAALANQDFTQYYNRLMGLSTLGENAAAGGASTANAAGAAAQNAGAQQSSIYGGAAAGLGGTLNNLLGDKNFQNTVGSWFSSPTPNYTAGTTNAFGTSAGYGNQLFNPGGVF